MTPKIAPQRPAAAGPAPTPADAAESYQERFDRRGREVDEILQAAIDAFHGGEDVGAAVAAMRESRRPEVPTLDSLAVGRLGGDGWTPDRQRAFLRHLAGSGCVSHACAHVGLSKQSAYQLRSRHPSAVFAIGWDVAARMGRMRLLDEATERALNGHEVAVWHRGEQVGTRTVVNDRLLMFLLAHQPAAAHPVLDDRQLAELWPLMLDQIDVVLPPSLTPDRLAELAAQTDDRAEFGNDGR